VLHRSFRSAAVKRTQELTVVVPEGGSRRPLLIFLHGKGGDADGFLYDEMFAALAAAGRRAPVVAFPDGGGGSYWHDRDSGDWERYVRSEVPREVAEVASVDLERVAVGGVSMGGFGAFSLARRGGYCAAGGHSPALWRTAGETAPGAFDDAEDFAEHDLIAHAADLDGTPLWLDAGSEDPFLSGDRGFAAATGARLRVSRGGHDREYWRAHWNEYVRFYAKALADCAVPSDR
jgi:S-formylglutathione hydrolase FrmB